MSKSPRFQRPEDLHNLDLRKKYLVLAYETIHAAARNRIRNLAANPVALTAYMDSCACCRGMGWTWCCKGHRDQGGPPNERCEHLSAAEVHAIDELFEEGMYLAEVEKEMKKGTIEVHDLEKDDEVPEFIKKSIIAHHTGKNAS